MGNTIVVLTQIALCVFDMEATFTNNGDKYVTTATVVNCSEDHNIKSGTIDTTPDELHKTLLIFGFPAWEKVN